ncbi:MAG: hypothetical protein MUF49_31305 [Oculatellaceae cyanobacterium Prado106]|jgi:hypothetical protein|nr:hypothetical protein [Oculatellaceae cyanobacterium Prado106]
MTSITISLETGLEALKQGKSETAIEIFEAFCQNVSSDSRDFWQAQMHLVKTYQDNQQMERAIALCSQLCACPNAQVQIWAQQMMKDLNKSESSAESSAESAESTEVIEPQPTVESPEEPIVE